MQEQEYDGQAVVCQKRKKSPDYKGNSHGNPIEMEQTVRAQGTV